MNIANKVWKYNDKTVIEPFRVIQERKKNGLHPSCPELTPTLQKSRIPQILGGEDEVPL